MDATTEKGDTALIWASLHAPDERTSELLLRAGADPNAENNRNGTPLRLACTRGSVQKVRLLLENGADRTRCDNMGLTALYHAKMFGHSEIVALLER